MRAALLMGLIVGTLFSLMGIFVVTRGMAFFSDFIAHSAILGMALAVTLEAEPVVFLIIYSAAVSFLASAIWSRFSLSRDVVLGVLYGGTVATGIILISVRHIGQSRIFGFLFGDILLVRPLDIWLSLCLLAAFGLFLVFNMRKLVKSSLLPEISIAEGVRVKFYDYALIAVMAVTIALSIKLIGVMLANAMVVIPAAAAKAVSRNFRQFICIAPALGIASFFTGISLSFYLDIPSGPSVVASAFLFFLAALPFGALRR